MIIMKNPSNYKLKIETLRNDYHDPDMVLIHAAFQCLVNFVEKEDGLNHCNYEYHKKDIDKCKELYDWWKANHSKYSLEDKTFDEKLKELIEVYHFLWT